MVILANMERLPVNAVILSSIEIQLYTEVPGQSGYIWKFFQLRQKWICSGNAAVAVAVAGVV